MAFIAYSYTSKSSTPKVLQSSSTDRSYGDIKGGRGNILDKLFDEAKKDNDKLENTYSKIIDLTDDLNRQQSKINTYLNTNQSYYTAAKSEANTISDINLKEETLNLINTNEQAYLSKKKTAESYLQKIANNKQALHDHLAMLKVKVTASMMQNYQKNEEPVGSVLNDLIKEVDKLLSEIKSTNW